MLPSTLDLRRRRSLRSCGGDDREEVGEHCELGERDEQAEEGEHREPVEPKELDEQDVQSELDEPAE